MKEVCDRVYLNQKELAVGRMIKNLFIYIISLYLLQSSKSSVILYLALLADPARDLQWCDIIIMSKLNSC